MCLPIINRQSEHEEAMGPCFAKCWRRGALLLLVVAAFLSCKPRRTTTPTPGMEAERRHWVRVLLVEDVGSCTVKFGSSFEVIGESSDLKSEPGRRLFQEPGASTEIALSGGKITVSGRPFEGGQVSIRPEEPHVFKVNGSEYRGTLKLVIDSGAESFDVINYIPLEAYLAGVVGAEMPDYWEPEALKAQAIAARTYCLYIKKRFGSGRAWDLGRTQAHQVYRGVAAESAQIWDAVNKTRGSVLVCKQPDGTEGIFPTYYSSTCGGHTENSKNVFGDSFEPLAGVRCFYCEEVARPRFYFWPLAQFEAAEVTEKLRQRYPNLKELGEITDITAVEHSDYGGLRRLTKVKLSGSTGRSDFLRAEDLRLTVDPTGRRLRSTMCEITKSGDKWLFSLGRGYGHGVGMCQCGAQAMARQGKKAEEILLHYYPSSRISRVY